MSQLMLELGSCDDEAGNQTTQVAAAVSIPHLTNRITAEHTGHANS